MAKKRLGLQDTVLKIEAALDKQVSAMRQTAELAKGNVLAEFLSKEKVVFDALAKGYENVLRSKTVSQDLEYYLEHGEEGIERLPERFASQIRNSLDKVPDEFREGVKAHAYVTSYAAGQAQVALPMDLSSVDEGTYQLVYDKIKHVIKDASKKADVSTCTNGCIVINMNAKSKKDAGFATRISKRLASAFEEGPLNFLEVELIKTRMQVPLREDTQYLTSLELFDRYGFQGRATLYQGINDLALERVMDGKKRLFPPDQVAQLDEYFRQKGKYGSEEAQADAAEATAPSAEPMSAPRKCKYLGVSEVAKTLELSKRRVQKQMKTGVLKGAEKDSHGRWQVPASSVEQFRKQHVRMNMVYRASPK